MHIRDKGCVMERVRNTSAASVGKLQRGPAVVTACDSVSKPREWGQDEVVLWLKSSPSWAPALAKEPPGEDGSLEGLDHSSQYPHPSHPSKATGMRWQQRVTKSSQTSKLTSSVSHLLRQWQCLLRAPLLPCWYPFWKPTACQGIHLWGIYHQTKLPQMASWSPVFSTYPTGEQLWYHLDSVLHQGIHVKSFYGNVSCPIPETCKLPKKIRLFLMHPLWRHHAHQSLGGSKTAKEPPRMFTSIRHKWEH